MPIDSQTTLVGPPHDLYPAINQFLASERPYPPGTTILFGIIQVNHPPATPSEPLRLTQDGRPDQRYAKGEARNERQRHGDAQGGQTRRRCI